MSFFDPFPELIIPSLIFGILLFASLACVVLRLTPLNKTKTAFVDEIVSRTKSWWLIAVILVPCVLGGLHSTIVIFFILSICALREYLTLLDTGRAQHQALFWSFAVITPAQYGLIWIKWYGLYSIFIPVYAFLFIPIAIVLKGETERFLEHTAKIHWGLMAGVFLLSHAPALLTLNIPGHEGRGGDLLFYLFMVAQLSDIFQFIAGKSFGKRRISPGVSPNKTWGGFIGGLIGSCAVGVLLTPVTPFTHLESLGMSLAIFLAGFYGGLTMSAIKRDHGVKDYGALLPGHGGVLDRLDSLIFSAPLFFHLTRYYFTV